LIPSERPTPVTLTVPFSQPHNLVVVNALAPTARDTDAFATALMILGTEEGMKAAEEIDLIARFCMIDSNRTKLLYSTAYEQLFSKALEK
jgi:thiamine biosynthesis lipoprotein